MGKIRFSICLFFINLGIRLMPESWRTEKAVINMIIVGKIKVEDDDTLKDLLSIN